MRRFVIFLVMLMCFSPQALARTHVVEETSEFVEVEGDYARAEQLAYEEVLEKIAEHSQVYIEFLQKNRDEGFGESVAIKTMASVQRILEKNYIYQGSQVACHIRAEIDDGKLLKALDKAKVTAEKELYHEEANMNGRERDAYKAQSVNPVSLRDTDYENLLKQAKQAFLQRQYSRCIQYAQQAENASMYARNQKFQALSLGYLALANAKIGNFYEAIGFADNALSLDKDSIYAQYAKQISNTYLGNYYLAQESSFNLLHDLFMAKSPHPLVSVDEAYFYTCLSYYLDGDYENLQNVLNLRAFPMHDETLSSQNHYVFYLCDLADKGCQLDSDHFIKNYFLANIGNALSKTEIRLATFNTFKNKALVYASKGCNETSAKNALQHFKMAYAITKQYPEEYEYNLIAKEILHVLEKKYVKQYPDCIQFVTGEYL